MTTPTICGLCHHDLHVGRCTVSDMGSVTMHCQCPGTIESTALATSGGDEVPSIGGADVALVVTPPPEEPAAPEPVPSKPLWGYNLIGAAAPRLFLDDTFMPHDLGPGEHFGAVLIPMTTPCTAGCVNGVVTSPIWAAYAKYREVFDPAAPTHEQMRQWWSERGWDDLTRLPSDTDPCIECRGKGEVLTPTGERFMRFVRTWLS